MTGVERLTNTGLVGRAERPRAILGMGAEWPEALFSGAALAKLAELIDLDAHPLSQQRILAERRDLSEVEILIASWGAPVLDKRLLERMPRLAFVSYAAGSVKHLLSDEFIERNIRITSAARVNAIPVAEYTLAMIILSFKNVFETERRYRRDSAIAVTTAAAAPQSLGMFRRTVGVVGASNIGQKVIELLKPFDVDVLLADPYTRVDDPFVRQVSLEELIESSDIVSIHAPLTEETANMFDARQLARLRDGATLINTARGGLIDMPALITELSSGRISAVLDVTDPLEPLPAKHPLLALDNVTITPHMAGSLGSETRRLGEFAIDELGRYLAGQPLLGEVHPRLLAQTA